MNRAALAFLGLAILQGSPAAASGFTPASPLGSTMLDLDSQTGHFSNWRIDDASALNAVRATIQVHRLGEDKYWEPGFSITLRNGKDYAGFQILSATRRPPLTMHLAISKNGQTVEDQNFTTTIGLDEKLAVAIDWAADGTVKVQAGSETHTISFGEPVLSLEVSCSTGEVEFNPLQIGRNAP